MATSGLSWSSALGPAPCRTTDGLCRKGSAGPIIKNVKKAPTPKSTAVAQPTTASVASRR